MTELIQQGRGIPTYPPRVCEKILSPQEPYACKAIIVIRASSGHILTWVPVKNLKQRHKKLYRRILEELYGKSCFICKKEIDENGQEANNLDHLDGDTTHNCFHNILKAHHKCNSQRFWDGIASKDSGIIPTNMSVSVLRTNGRADWQSEEGRLHEPMRARFNAWLYHPQKPFAKMGERFSIKGLAKKAVHAVGAVDGQLRSSVTYERYLQEDLAGGFWQTEDSDGVETIERSDKPFPLEPTSEPNPSSASESKEEMQKH